MSSETTEFGHPDTKSLMQMLVKITVYYLLVFAALFVIAKMMPSFINELPVGGVSDMAGYDEPSVYEMEQALLGDDLETVNKLSDEKSKLSVALSDAMSLFLAMLGTIILMLPVAWVYNRIHRNDAHDHSLDETALILPSVVAGIVMVVQYSLALAFSLAGIVAGVQFRRALSDTFDTLFIFVAIGVGIAAGIKALEIAFVMTAFFNYITIIVCASGDGLESHHRTRKKQLKKEKGLEKLAEANDVEAGE